MFRAYHKLWLALLALIILSPLGLIAGGTAFGEWGGDELLARLGYIPDGFARLSTLWRHILLPDYTVPAMGESFVHAAIGYVVSALVGVLAVVLVIMLFGRLWGQRD